MWRGEGCRFGFTNNLGLSRLQCGLGAGTGRLVKKCRARVRRVGKAPEMCGDNSAGADQAHSRLEQWNNKEKLVSFPGLYRLARGA